MDIDHHRGNRLRELMTELPTGSDCRRRRMSAGVADSQCVVGPAARRDHMRSPENSERGNARMLTLCKLRESPSNRSGFRVARRTILKSTERRQSYMLLALGLLIASALPFLLRAREYPAAPKSIPASSE